MTDTTSQLQQISEMSEVMESKDPSISSQSKVEGLGVYDGLQDGSLPVGLVNKRNNCWFNTVVQSLFHIREFRVLIVNYSPPGSDSQMFIAKLRQLFALMLCSQNSSIDPTETIESFTKTHQTFGDGKQEDIIEFMESLLELLKEAFQSMMGADANSQADTVASAGGTFGSGVPSHGQPTGTSEIGAAETLMGVEDHGKNYIEQLFYGSGTEEGTPFTFWHLPLRLIKSFADVCQSLEQDFGAPKRLMAKLPPVLILDLIRCDDDKQGKKLHNKFTFPETLHLDRFLDHNKATVKQEEEEIYKQSGLREDPYKLHAVLMHQGDAKGGHYWAFINHQQIGWVRLDDDRNVMQYSWDEVTKESYGGDPDNPSAYCLIYINEAKLTNFVPVDLGKVFQSLPNDLKKSQWRKEEFEKRSAATPHKEKAGSQMESKDQPSEEELSILQILMPDKPENVDMQGETADSTAKVCANTIDQRIQPSAESWEPCTSSIKVMTVQCKGNKMKNFTTTHLRTEASNVNEEKPSVVYLKEIQQSYLILLEDMFADYAYVYKRLPTPKGYCLVTLLKKDIFKTREEQFSKEKRILATKVEYGGSLLQIVNCQNSVIDESAFAQLDPKSRLLIGEKIYNPKGVPKNILKNQSVVKTCDVIFLKEGTELADENSCLSNWLKIKGNTLTTYIRECFEASIYITPSYQQIVLKRKIQSVLLLNVSNGRKNILPMEEYYKEWKSKHKDMPYVRYDPESYDDQSVRLLYGDTLQSDGNAIDKSALYTAAIFEEVQSATRLPNQNAQQSVSGETVSRTRSPIWLIHVFFGAACSIPLWVGHFLKRSLCGIRYSAKDGPKPGSKRRIKVTTMNLNGIGYWPRERNKATIDDLVKQSPPSDVIGLQEVNSFVAMSQLFSLDDYMVIVAERSPQTQPTQSTQPEKQNIALNYGTLLRKTTFKQILAVSTNQWFLLVRARDWMDRDWFIGNIHMKAFGGDADSKKRQGAFEALYQELEKFKEKDICLILGDANIYDAGKKEDQAVKSDMDDVWEQLSPNQQTTHPYTFNEDKTGFFAGVNNFNGKDSNCTKPSRCDRVYLQKGRYTIVPGDDGYKCYHEHITITTVNGKQTVPCSDHFAVIVMFDIARETVQAEPPQRTEPSPRTETSQQADPQQQTEPPQQTEPSLQKETSQQAYPQQGTEPPQGT